MKRGWRWQWQHEAHINEGFDFHSLPLQGGGPGRGSSGGAPPPDPHPNLSPCRGKEHCGARAGMTALITLDDAGVHFGARAALAGVNFLLAAGERVMLVGANGSGKTTLLRLLHGQLPHSGQRLTPTDAKGREPTQAMVFQRPFLLRLSVWHNLLIALWLAGVPKPERAARAQGALERVGLARERDRPARVLSGGQQQRLALARAWAVQPEVLFLDEPTASLDPGAKREVEALIESFARDDGVAIVMSTHNLGQAKRLGTRVVYLDAGQVLVDLPTAMFFYQSLPEPAAQFVKGENPWSV
jgi:tungstate transport system ATP-binding protein